MITVSDQQNPHILGGCWRIQCTCNISSAQRGVCVCVYVGGGGGGGGGGGVDGDDQRIFGGLKFDF